LTDGPDTTPADDVAATVAHLRRRARFIKRRIPLGAQATKLLNRVVLVLFANPIANALIDLAALALMTYYVTAEARRAVDAWWFSVLVVAVVIAVWGGIAVLRPRLLELLGRLENGRPGFGELGGLPERLLRTTIRASGGLSFRLSEDDEAVMKGFSQLGKRVDEVIIKESFLEHERRESPGLSDEELEASWADVWEHELLEYPVGDSRLRDGYEAPSYAVGIIPLRLVQVGMLLGPIILASQFLLGFLCYRALTGSTSWVTVLQVTLAISFLLTAIVYLNHLKSLQVITVLEVAPALREKLPEDMLEEADRLAGEEIFPRRIVFTPDYVSTIRNHFGRSIGVVTAFNATVQLGAVALAFVLALAASASYGSIARDYAELALALAAIPLAMVVAYFLASLLVQHLRSTLAIVAGAIVTALLPIGLEYLLSGEVSTSTRTIVASAVTGVAGAVAAAAGKFLTDRGSEAREPEPA
jgi:hypothetical protein